MNKNALVLAYIGDSIYDIYVREYLVKNTALKPDLLQKESSKYVSAKGQALFLSKLLEDNVLNEKELDIMRRGRNHKVGHHPKNVDITTYKKATGLEAVIGFLYLEKDYEKLNEILERVFK
jgi:ribonuclease-3 family protein